MSSNCLNNGSGSNSDHRRHSGCSVCDNHSDHIGKSVASGLNTPSGQSEECGIFGVYAPNRDVARLSYFGLHALQHRGQESAGIAVADGQSISHYKDLGLVSQVFSEESLSALVGHAAIGHVRYSTSGAKSSAVSAQPHLSAIGNSLLALCHNGTLVNTNDIKVKLTQLGLSLKSDTDSEIAARIISHYTISSGHITAGISEAMSLIEGAYAMCLITSTALYAFRDPRGIRPLALGRLENDGGWVVASETCAFDIVGAKFVSEVAPGQIVRISGTKDADVAYFEGVTPKRRGSCIFEYVYFARPDSVIDGLSVARARDKMGRLLSVEAPVAADVVIGVPDSGVPSAIGYARESGIPYVEGIVKNRYVGRTFIQPTQEMRKLGIRIKLNPLEIALKGKRIIVIDDSIVRGNTSKQLVDMLYAAGAKEVHMRIVSPPVAWPCFFGIDTDTQGQLIAAKQSVEEIREYIGATSLAYLSLQGLQASVDKAQHSGFCMACFNGDYPTQVSMEASAVSFLPAAQPTFWTDNDNATNRLF